MTSLLGYLHNLEIRYNPASDQRVSPQVVIMLKGTNTVIDRLNINQWPIDPYAAYVPDEFKPKTHTHELHVVHVRYAKLVREGTLIEDPYNAYLFIGNLIVCGYNPKTHKDWASFFVNRVGMLIQRQMRVAALIHAEKKQND